MADVDVRPISDDELPQIRDWIFNHHYLERWPTGVRYKMGIYLDGKLVGTLLYGPPLRPQSGKELFHDENDQPMMQNNQILELLRAFTTDEAKSAVDNLGSMVVSKGNEYITKHGRSKDGKPLHAILSYADPEVGHKGGVYKATNAAYLGTQPRGRVLVIRDPKTGKAVEVHAMSVKNAYGTSSIEKLQQIPQLKGAEIKWRPTAGKHKYIWALGKDQKEKDNWMAHLVPQLHSYPDPEKPSKPIPNEAKERWQKRQQQTQRQQKKGKAPESKRGVIKKLLQTKIKNPETGNQILVATALRYEKSHPANKTARHIVNAYSKQHGIKVKPSKLA